MANCSGFCHQVLAKINDDKKYLLWAIENLPNLENNLLVHLGLDAKRDVSEEEIARIDKIMDGVPNWFSGEPPPPGSAEKLIVFVIDRTWLPILSVCISSIKSIFQKYVDEKDRVGLYSLGEGWIFQPNVKTGHEESMASDIVAAEKMGGECVLYNSMREALDCLQAGSSRYSKWLVVLTDLVDLEGIGGEPGENVSPNMRVLAPRALENAALRAARVVSCKDTTSEASERTAVLRFEDPVPLAPPTAEQTTTTQEQDGDASGAAAEGVRIEQEQETEEIPTSKIQLFAGMFDRFAGMDPELERRLKKAGARVGQVTLSLKWDSTDDLDIHVDTPAGEISFSDKQKGGGWLDVDMNPCHETNEPVENVFWNEVEFHQTQSCFFVFQHHCMDSTSFNGAPEGAPRLVQELALPSGICAFGGQSIMIRIYLHSEAFMPKMFQR